MEKYVLGNAAPFVQKLKRLALILIVIGAIGSVAGIILNYSHFMLSYLVAVMVVGGISVTALFFVMVQFLTRAGWSVLIRRVPEFLSAFTPFLIFAFLPILFDAWVTHSIFEWTHKEVVMQDHVLQSKAPYLNEVFFTVRTLIYVLAWFWMYRIIIGNSLRQDETTDIAPTLTNFKRSGPFVVLYGLTLTFAAFDYLMSLQPHWYSTIFGVYFFAGSFVATIALITIFVVLLKEGGYLPGVTVEHYHNLGKYLFAFTVFWTYIAFSQYFLIWYGNIPEEILFYLRRYEPGWIVVSWALLFVHFIIPFVLLLPQKSKRNPKMLLFVSAMILVIHYFEMHWVAVAAHHKTFTFGYEEIAAIALLGGIFLWIVARQFAKHSLVPVQDPFLEESKEAVSWGNAS